jgi:hypothetical protein
MLAINLDGHYYSIDDDTSELLVLNRVDLIKYQFCLEVFAEQVAKVNDFSGSLEKPHRRMYYAVDRIIDDNKVALVLAFIDQEQQAEDLFLGLPGRLPAGIQAVLRSHTLVYRTIAFPIGTTFNKKSDTNGMAIINYMIARHPKFRVQDKGKCSR